MIPTDLFPNRTRRPAVRALPRAARPHAPSAGMDPQHSSETIQALRFGEKCAVVENEARNQASCIAGLIAALDADIAETRAQIRAKERWETRQVFKATDKDEDGVVTQEYVTQSALVGAEEEQARLDELLQRRRELLGEEEEEGAPADPPARDEASPGKGPAEALVLGPEPPKKRPRAPPARFLRAQEKQQEKADEAAARQAQRAERRAEAEQRRAALLNERKAKARQNSEMVLQVLQQKAAHAASGSSSGGLPPPPMRRVAYDEDLPMAAAQRAQVQCLGDASHFDCVMGMGWGAFQCRPFQGRVLRVLVSSPGLRCSLRCRI